MDRDFKPFRYLTPKPKQYPNIRKRKKEIEESSEEDNSPNLKMAGLVLIAMSALVGTGLILTNKCTEAEQKAENYYNQTIEKEYSNQIYEYQ